MSTNENKNSDDAIRAALKAVEKQDGTLTPTRVVEAAKPKSSPMHDSFEWDDSIAGQKFREEQARTLIRTVWVEREVEGTFIEMPLYVRDPRVAGDEQGYVSLGRLPKVDQRSLIELELARVESLLTRVELLAQGLGLSEYVVVISKKVKSFRKIVGREAQA